MIVRVVAATAALVLGVATVAAPAMADPLRTVPAPAVKAPAEVATDGELTTKAVNPSTRYCVKTEITGSRLPRRECHTRQQWLDLGYDPLVDLRR
ncbi:hypothetical protein LK533_09745 [Sphingomonas sp. PL-96]|uniref:hypothetical protein n=1 Tax=Sphingomonas sp. PL-96 TaxID=2887201 RepID=UPI001E5054A2|nr:hypothetical protein [Sphingomonas sp. PL-96]MCC2976953.1 hypothetical protein [Sphingomonas sp. PL-96]